MPLELPTIRSKFPTLRRPAIFFDNPVGTRGFKILMNRYSAYFNQERPRHGIGQQFPNFNNKPKENSKGKLLPRLSSGVYPQFFPDN
jgi:hypothetical protein